MPYSTEYFNNMCFLANGPLRAPFRNATGNVADDRRLRATRGSVDTVRVTCQNGPRRRLCAKRIADEIPDHTLQLAR